MTPHIPVLSSELLALCDRSLCSLDSGARGVFVDCTLGFAGHAEMILSRFKNLRYFGIDRDETAIAFSAEKLRKFGDRVKIAHGAFSEKIKEVEGEIAGVLADFGVSSLQLDDRGRGFGFESEKLDMRMDKSASFSAADIVNGYDEAALVQIFKDYGEETHARQMARLIVENRPFSGAKELSTLIASRFGRQSGGKIHAATKIFQAIRLETNDELGEIERLLDFLGSAAPKSALIAMISFHSLEDRMVKDRFKAWAKNCVCPEDSWRCECGGHNAKGLILTKKPITAGEGELRANPRSRSAKLRGFQFEH